MVPDAAVLLGDSQSAFIEIDRPMSFALLIAKLKRYRAYRTAPATGRGHGVRPPRSYWQET
ncbi:hypothetical protein ACIPSE_46545 [Streptomyces sp. NPDC090106]|uniref:hypothetical protein n=1 Tax=Streptomyces sp. NPDC090106 TaxID=3365946 RepID=UPI00381A30BC